MEFLERSDHPGGSSELLAIDGSVLRRRKNQDISSCELLYM
jgi:hypothetical protein